MSDRPTTPSPFQITKRDLETVRYQNEPMRQASWTFPAVMLPGEDWPRVRQFALDTVMQMKQLYPEQFKGKTQQDWESALTNFIATRRPDFRAQVLGQLKARYGEGKAMDPDLVLTKAIEGFGKKAQAIFMDEIAKISGGLIPKGQEAGSVASMTTDKKFNTVKRLGFNMPMGKAASVESVYKRLVSSANGDRLKMLLKKIEAFKATKPRGV